MQWQRIDKKAQQDPKQASSSSEPDYQQVVDQELKDNKWEWDNDQTPQHIAAAIEEEERERKKQEEFKR